jgi:hypothetical protein
MPLELQEKDGVYSASFQIGGATRGCPDVPGHDGGGRGEQAAGCAGEQMGSGVFDTALTK